MAPPRAKCCIPYEYFTKCHTIINKIFSSILARLADALVLDARKTIDFIDAYNAVFMKYQGLREIYSHDVDVETIEDIEMKEP